MLSSRHVRYQHTAGTFLFSQAPVEGRGRGWRWTPFGCNIACVFPGNNPAAAAGVEQGSIWSFTCLGFGRLDHPTFAS
jgi:hypothetical protein